MRKILVYLPNAAAEDAIAHFGSRFPDDLVEPRNVRAHTPGQLEACDLCLVDDRHPHVADEFREGGFEARTFDVNELGVEPVAEEEPFRRLFASPTAYDEAIKAGMTPGDLDDLDPAGKTGYTTAQIRSLVEAE